MKLRLKEAHYFDCQTRLGFSTDSSPNSILFALWVGLIDSETGDVGARHLLGESLALHPASIDRISPKDLMNADPVKYLNLKFNLILTDSSSASSKLFPFAIEAPPLAVRSMHSLKRESPSNWRTSILLQRTHRALLMGNECTQLYRDLLSGICC